MTLKEKIKNGEKLIGTHVFLSNVSISKIAGLSGYDYVWIDLEHGTMSIDDLLATIIAVKSGGSAVVVRVPQNDLTYTKKVMDLGVDGIIFPMVKTAEEANEQIANTLYPPYGTRGFGPMNAVDYGFADVKEYITHPVDNTCRFIQIEHVDAVNNLEEIMKNEYIDGYIFGPNDLSGSINRLCEIKIEPTLELMRKTISTLKAAGKYVGISTGDLTEEGLKFWHDMDIDMISSGGDYTFMMQGFIRNREILEKVHKYAK